MLLIPKCLSGTLPTIGFHPPPCHLLTIGALLAPMGPSPKSYRVVISLTSRVCRDLIIMLVLCYLLMFMNILRRSICWIKGCLFSPRAWLLHHWSVGYSWKGENKEIAEPFLATTLFSATLLIPWNQAIPLVVHVKELKSIVVKSMFIYSDAIAMWIRTVLCYKQWWFFSNSWEELT